MKAIARLWANANRRRHYLMVNAALLALVLAVTDWPTGLAQPAHATGVAPLATQSAGLRADFDGNGISDLAVGVPNEDIGAPGFEEEDAGAVNIIYGTANGLTAVGNQLWDQGSVGIFGDVEAGDQFGYALAAADFNGDGRTDLAISAPGENYLNTAATGIVHVLYGSPAGLTATGSGFFTQNDANIFGELDTYDFFGESLAAADFDHDGNDDLVIGTPRESFIADNSGVVHVLYGSTTGLRAAGSDFFSQNNVDIYGDAEEGDEFGLVLATADFNGDDFADLAIGSPYESVWAASDGIVHVLYGSTTGLRATGSDYFSQNHADIFGVPEDYDEFGFSLAAADFDGDGDGDLAIGTPYEDHVATNDGVVHVLYGSTTGLRATGSDFYSQDDAAIYGVPEEYDNFGWSLAAGNFGNGSQSDLAIGVPGEGYANTRDGGVHVLYGTTNGLDTTGSQFWSQDGPALVEDAEYQDHFGHSLTTGNFGNGNYADLAVGVPFKAPSGAGGVHVIYGSTAGLTGTDDSFWTQYALVGGEEPNDNFGYSLTAG